MVLETTMLAHAPYSMALSDIPYRETNRTQGDTL